MNPIKLTYFQTLKKIQKVLKIHYNPNPYYKRYIKYRCVEATKLTHLILPNLKEQIGDCSNHFHAWNYDPTNNLIIDLSAWQFKNLNITPNTIIFSPKTKTHKFNKNNLENYLESLKTPTFQKEIKKLYKTYQNLI